MKSLTEDIRYGWRILWKRPVFTLIAALTLALGIGANTAVFSLVNAFLLRPLAVPNPQELVFVRDREPDNSSGPGFDRKAFEALRDHNRTFSGLVALDDSNISAVVDSTAEYDRVDFVTGNYYSVLGVPALKGRLLSAEDDRPGSQPVAVISYSYWQQRLGGDPNPLGKVVRFKNVSCNIVGITSPDFRGVDAVGNAAAFTLPMNLQPDLSLKDHTTFELFGRVQKGVSTQQARSDLEVLFHAAQRYAAGSGSDPEGRDLQMRHIEVASASRGDMDDESLPRELRILQGIVGLVLLIACANVANLLLASGTSRRREIALRMALGATRGRVIRQLLAENLLLGSFGGTLGFFLGLEAVRLLSLVLGVASTQALTAGLDAGTMAFTAGVSVTAVLVFGLIPAMRTSDITLSPELKDGGVTFSGGARNSRTTSILLTSQVSVSVVVLVLTGLLVRTLGNLQRVDLGFQPNGLVLFWLFPTLAGYSDSQEVQLANDVPTSLSTLPGVRSATLTRYSILRNGRAKGLVVSGARMTPAANATYVLSAVGPSFFRTLQIPFVLGRDFSLRDAPSAPSVAIVNEAFAAKYFDGTNSIGAAIHLPGESMERTIIGVVGNMKFGLRDYAPADAVYIPFAQASGDMRGQMLITLSIQGNVDAVLPAVREQMRSTAKDLPMVGVTTEDEQVQSRTGEERSLAQLLGSFGLLALSLTLVGLYSTVSFAVARRTKEIAIRIALGAQPSQVLRLVLGQSVRPVVTGLILGIPLAVAASGVLRSLLFQVHASDPVTYIVISAVLLGTALFAAYVPARRGGNISAATALKYE
ncbi:MAG TPA: ABC transporter permease [Candidatus Sulfotelmatobacter sp.]|nr:ABC transporter permease [Candidatus Sulfotelmatobacter sp.]